MLFAEHNFKTSHVIVYLFSCAVKTLSPLISIHLMLLFITLCVNVLRCQHLFQNISCYCLSKRLRALVTVEAYFKTSHVIVYHKRK